MSRGSLVSATTLAALSLAGVLVIQRAQDWSIPLDEAAAAADRRTYVTGIFEDITARNPWARLGPNNTVWNSYVGADVYPALFAYATKSLSWTPMVASDMPAPLELDAESGLWRSAVRLREGLLWSDGTPVTAHDVAFTFRAIAALDSAKLGGNFPSLAPPDLIDHAEARDDLTVEFFLKRRDARYRFGLLLAPIFQQGFWEPHLKVALASNNPPQTMFDVDVTDEPVFGSFLHGTWERGSFVNRPANRRYSLRGTREVVYRNGPVRITDNEFDWSGYGTPEGEPDVQVEYGPYVDSVHYRVYGNQAAGVLALQAGQVDFLFNSLGLEKGFQDQLRGEPGITLVENATNGMRYMGLNLRREPMKRLPFRQAVATLIDREFVTERVLQGVAFPLFSVVPPGNEFWYNPKVPRYGDGLSRADRIREAVRLLEAGGFSWASKPVLDAAGTLVQPGRGLRMPDGTPVRPLEIIGPGEAYDPLRAAFANWIERWLNEVGIPVRSNLSAFNVVVERVSDRQDFDMFILGWSLSLYPEYLNAFFHSRNSNLRGLNAQGYQNPEYDKLVEEFLAEADDMNRARELAFGLQEYLARDLPYIVLFETPLVEAYRSDRVRYPTTEGLAGIQGVQQGLRSGFIHAVQLAR